MSDARERKRRKWDVAAPQGIPVAAGGRNRPGIGVAQVGSTPAMAGFITPQGTSIQPPQADTQYQARVQSAATPASSGPPSAAVIARAKQGALSVLEKINQDLRAKGGLPMKSGSKLDDESIKREVTINDAPGPIRYNLTRRATQDDIARRTGTHIVVRGQYMAPGMPRTTDEPPLLLKITPGMVASESEYVQQQAVDRAAGEVRHILQGGQPGTYIGSAPAFGQAPPPTGGGPQYYPPPGQSAGPRAPLSSPYAHAQPPDQVAYQVPSAVPLYVGFEAPPDFNLAARLRGEGDAYLKHIAKQTGAQVVLKGQGSGMVETLEMVHIYITGGDQKGNDEAVRLAKNLIDTVRGEFRRTYPQGCPPAISQPVPSHPGGFQAQPGGAYPQNGPVAYQGGAYPAAGAPGQYPASAVPPAQNSVYPYHSYPSPCLNQPTPGYYPPPSSVYPLPGSQAQGVYLPVASHAYPSPEAQGYAPHPASQHVSLHSDQGYHQQVSAQQQQQYAGTPPQQLPHNTAQPPPSSPAAAAVANGSNNDEAQQRERKRRFKEFKDTPPPVPAQPAPYAPQPMGPPPPRMPANPGTMGPPPPRAPQQGGSGNATNSNVSGSLAGLVDYD